MYAVCVIFGGTQASGAKSGRFCALKTSLTQMEL